MEFKISLFITIVLKNLNSITDHNHNTPKVELNEAMTELNKMQTLLDLVPTLDEAH